MSTRRPPTVDEHRRVGSTGSRLLRRLVPRPGTVGTDPDPRFTLANERTFLAWNRTALALIGGGLAVSQFVDFTTRVAHLVGSIMPAAVGVVLAVASLRRWSVMERALRLRLPLPMSTTPSLLAGCVAMLGVATVVGVLLDAPTR